MYNTKKYNVYVNFDSFSSVVLISYIPLLRSVLKFSQSKINDTNVSVIIQQEYLK